ncbi:MAG: hypothetical protein ACRDOS_07065 [Gaiellaceae bacterium]
MTEIQGRAPLLVLVDELTRSTNAPVLVPDLRGIATYVIEGPSERELFFSPTIIFHTLRDMVADGLIAHSVRGYELTPAGRDEAALVREESPQTAERAAQAVREYAVQ